MADEEIRNCSREIEIIVLQRGDEHEMRLRVNGSTVFDVAPFTAPNETTIYKLCEDLDSFSTDSGYFHKYHETEAALGRLLADSLFAPRCASGESLLGTILNRVLCGLGPGEYVRLLLSFQEPGWSKHPWELALWTHPATKEEMCLGRERRMTLSRLDPGRSGVLARRVVGRDRLLSVLNIGADGSSIGEKQHTLAKDFLHVVGEYIQGIHATSREFGRLEQYWVETAAISGRQPTIDVVHWQGHGYVNGLEASVQSDDQVKLSAARLIERTQEAFLYVLLSCNSAGPSKGAVRAFSSALLDAGAPAVLAVHDSLRSGEFAEVLFLYPLLALGLPLDFCVQYLRRLFARKNDESSQQARVCWHKLALRTTSPWYLDSEQAQGTRLQARTILPLIALLIHHFAALRRNPRAGGEAASVDAANKLIPAAAMLPPGVAHALPDGKGEARAKAVELALPWSPEEIDLLKCHYDALLLD